MAIKLNSSGGGSSTIDSAVTASNLTFTLPSASGTLTTTSGSTFADITVTGNSYFATSSGNVGVGTSSPTEKLTVAGNIKLGTSGTSWLYGPATNGRSILSNSDSTAYIGIYGSAYGSSLNSTLQFIVGTSNTMTLDSSGNLGLGVTPNGWYSTFRAFQFGGYGSSVYGRSENSSAGMASNSYINTSGNWTYINSSYASNYQQLNGIHTWYGAPSGTAGASTTFTTLLSVEKDKTLTLQSATSATGTGITFPATQSASSDANTLDDYEEGTWAPTFTAAGYTFSYTAGTLGTYTKVGRQVTVKGYVRLSASPSGSGNTNLYISSMPFAAANDVTQYGAGSILIESSSSAFAGIPTVRSNQASTSLSIFQIVAGASPVYVFNVANISANMEFEFTVTYFV